MLLQRNDVMNKANLTLFVLNYHEFVQLTYPKIAEYCDKHNFCTLWQVAQTTLFSYMKSAICILKLCLIEHTISIPTPTSNPYNYDELSMHIRYAILDKLKYVLDIYANLTT